MRVVCIVIAAWTSGLACIGVSIWHTRRVERMRSPGVATLLERAREAGEADFARAELRELGSEADRALALAHLVPRSLTRVALTSGTALGVLVLATGGALGLHVIGALLAFAGGALGTLGSAIFGQRAKAVAHVAKAEWRTHLREVERRIGQVDPG